MIELAGCRHGRKQRGKAAATEHGSSSLSLAPLRREGARSCAHHEFVQERLLPGGRLNNRRAWATRWVASSGRLRASFSLFAFALRDRGQVSVAIDCLFAHVFPAAEQEYCEGDRDHCA
jgi:hypothetical protein